MTASIHPFETLTPDLVMDALASVGLYGDGRLMALSSYENRVYQAHLEDGRAVVAKFYRPQRWTDQQILEEHSFSAELMAAEIPVVGPLSLQGSTLNHFGDFAFSVSPRRGGRAPELDDPDVLEWVGRFLARIHAVGAQRPFVSRPALDLASFGIEPREWLLAHDQVPLDVQALWARTSQQAIDVIAACPFFAGASQAREAEPIRQLRLHGDCHPGNLLWTDAGPHFVDLDDAAMGPAIQDLWMLMDGGAAQRAALLEGYAEFRDLDAGELALIEPLRIMRQVHHAGWIAARWSDPAFPRAFPFAAEPRWWEEHCDDLMRWLEAD